MRRTHRSRRPLSQAALCGLSLLAAAVCVPAHAALSLLTSPTQFTPDAFIDWDDVGPPSTRVPTPAFFIDVKNTPLTARVSEAPTNNIDGFQRLESGLNDPRNGFITYPLGIFPTGEQLLFTGVDGVSTGNIGFDFSQPVFGFGLSLHHPGLEISFNTQIEAFDNSGNSLGGFIVDAPGGSSPAGRFISSPAAFFGIQSTSRNIASILITPPAAAMGTIVNEPLVQTGLTPNLPTGATAAQAILPTVGTPNEEGSWVFDNVAGGGKWFDPPLTDGYVYETTDGVSNFVEVELPTGIGDADNQFLLEAAGIGAVLLSGGDRYAFPTPVDTFTVTGINPLVDGGDPLAFPTFLVFDQLTVSFTQTPIPEPAAVTLFIIFAGMMKRSNRTIV
ncbi:MAG: hypothetical protein AAGF84_09015 [Planctomycetota bacterium]